MVNNQEKSALLDKMDADQFNGFPGFELPDLKPKFSILILTESGWNISCLNNHKEQGLAGDNFY